ncbi:acyl-CoA dehydrogenase family protein [Gammaproteobacteria bacterium]|nr:acyl-CoA dehydrogenase family protein [Gammaproteobacteria bacterium]
MQVLIFTCHKNLFTKLTLIIMQDYKTEHPFDIAMSEEQQMTWDMLRKFAETEMRPIARDAEAAGRPSDELLGKMKDLDLIPLGIPEAYGGMEIAQDATSQALALEALAYGDLSLAMSLSLPMLTAKIITEHGSEEQKKELLKQYSDGSMFHVGLGINNSSIMGNASNSSVSVDESGEELILNGTKTGIAFAEEATSFLISATSESGESNLYVLDKDTEGLEITSKEFMGLKGLPLSEINLSNCKIKTSQKLGGHNYSINFQELLDSSRIGMSAMALGVCQAVLDYVVPYTNERVAFDEPISNRQSVAFLVADMAIEIEAMRLMVYKAAALKDIGADFHKQASLTHRFAAHHGMKIGTDGVQLLGGHGFTHEHPVELWYRNLRAIGIFEAGAGV